MSLEAPTSGEMKQPRRQRTFKPAPEPQFLLEGETCWRVAQADRVALLVDGAAYFAAAKAAMLNAKHSIWLLAWVFDPLTRMTPDPSARAAPRRAPTGWDSCS